MDAVETYTTDVDPERAAAIPAMQRAARDHIEYLSTRVSRPLALAYAQGVDDILSWLDGEQSDDLIASYPIRLAAIQHRNGGEGHE